MIGDASDLTTAEREGFEETPPGLYYPGIGGCRFEDCVVITKTGCELLSKHPYNWEIA